MVSYDQDIVQIAVSALSCEDVFARTRGFPIEVLHPTGYNLLLRFLILLQCRKVLPVSSMINTAESTPSNEHKRVAVANTLTGALIRKELSAIDQLGHQVMHIGCGVSTSSERIRAVRRCSTVALLPNDKHSP